MKRKLCVTITLLTIVLLGVGSVLADTSVGVKKGDWAEYNVEYTGTPPEGHNVIWARIEIGDIQGKIVNANITVEFSNGTQATMAETWNLQTGQLGDDFIIPTDLNKGDTFLDKTAGSITISSVEEKTYAGATRTIAHATTSVTSYYWDRATGLLVEGDSELPDYVMNTTITETNIWQPQLFGLDAAVFYALAIGAAVLIAVVVAVLVFRRKK
jgi:hypothetical protein